MDQTADDVAPEQDVAPPVSQDPYGPDVREPITISATRITDTPLVEQPYAAHSYDRQAINDVMAPTLVDSLAYTPGVFVQRTAASQASPFIRGLTGEQTLLLFDGVRLSHAMMRPGPNQYAAMVPDESVERIDVILGPSSTVTGSDGLTGALDYRLHEAGRDVEEGIGVFAMGQADTAHGGSAALGLDGATGDWRWSIEGSYATYGDIQGGKDADDRLFFGAADNDEIPNSGYDRFGIAARAAYVGMENHRFEVSAGTNVISDAPRADGYPENSGSQSRISRSFDPQAFTYLHLRHNWQNPDDGLIDATQSTLWWHQHDEEQSRERIRDSGTPNEYYRKRIKEDTIDSYGLDVQLTSRVEAHEITWGTTYVTETTSNAISEFRTPDGDTNPDNATENTISASNTTVPDGAEYDSLGLFVQDLWTIDDTWELLGGLRYSLYQWEADVTGRGYDTDFVDGDTDGITGQVRAGWQASDMHSGFFGVAQGFRAPNLTNLTGKQDRGSSGNPVAGNPNLDPETSWSYETGYRLQLTERSAFEVDVFYTQIDDVIQRVFRDVDGDGNLDGITQNGESATLYGGEFTADIHLMSWDDIHFSLQNATSYVESEQEIPQPDGSIDEEPISRANRLYGKVGLRADFLTAFWSTVRVRWHDAYDEDDVAPGDDSDVRLSVVRGDGTLPGYAVVDILVGWQPEPGKQIGIKFENLFNKTYREVGSSTDRPGFNVALDAAWRF